MRESEAVATRQYQGRQEREVKPGEFRLVGFVKQITLRRGNLSEEDNFYWN